jgi:hypothetical protein
MMARALFLAGFGALLCLGCSKRAADAPSSPPKPPEAVLAAARPDGGETAFPLGQPKPEGAKTRGCNWLCNGYCYDTNGVCCSDGMYADGTKCCSSGARCGGGAFCCASGCCSGGTICTYDGYCELPFRYYFGNGRTCTFGAYLCNDRCYESPPPDLSCEQGRYLR